MNLPLPYRKEKILPTLLEVKFDQLDAQTFRCITTRLIKTVKISRLLFVSQFIKTFNLMEWAIENVKLKFLLVCACTGQIRETLQACRYANFSLAFNADGFRGSMWKVLCWILVSLASALCRSAGVSNVACQNMTPIHGSSVPQESIARVQIVPHSYRLKRGQQIKVSLRAVSSNFTFRGFMIQARNVQSNEILGSFLPISDAKIMACGNSFSTASHSNPRAKTVELLLWKAPTNFRGYVRFQWVIGAILSL